MNALPNPQTNGIAGLLQGGPQAMAPGMPPQGMAPGMPPQGMAPGMPPQGMAPGMPPQGMAPGMAPGMPPQGMAPGMPPQGMARPAMRPPASGNSQQTPLDPKLLQAFENLKLRQAAQRQQLMQTPNMPPVVQQLQDQAMQMRQVSQAAERQVPSMAGGGIVAFSGGGPARSGGFSFGRDLPFSTDDASAPPVDQNDNDVARYANKGSRYFQTQLPDDKVRAMIRDAKTGNPGAVRILTEYVKQYPSHVVQISNALASQRAAEPPTGVAALTAKPPTAAPAPAPAGPRMRSPTPPVQPGAQPAPEQPPPPAPTAAGLDALLEQYGRDELKVDPTKQRDEDAAWYKQQMGMEPLLKAQEERLKGIEALYGKRQKPGIEDWLMGLASAKPDNNPTSGLLGAATTYRKAVSDAEARDLDFAIKMANARDAGMKLQIEGNKGMADAGMEGYKTGHTRRSNAFSRLTDLETKREATAQRAADSQWRKDQAAAELLARQEKARLEHLDRQAARSAAGREDTKTWVALANARQTALRGELNDLLKSPIAMQNPANQQRVREIREDLRTLQAEISAKLNIKPAATGGAAPLPKGTPAQEAALAKYGVK